MGTPGADHPSSREKSERKRPEKGRGREGTSVTRLSALPIYHTALDFFSLAINSRIGQHVRGKKGGTNKQALARDSPVIPWIRVHAVSRRNSLFSAHSPMLEIAWTDEVIGIFLVSRCFIRERSYRGNFMWWWLPQIIIHCVE